jgi:hypothetical protein
VEFHTTSEGGEKFLVTYTKGALMSWKTNPTHLFFHLPVLLQFPNNMFMLNKALRATGQNKHQSVTFLALFQSNNTEDKRKSQDRIRPLLYTVGLGTLLHGSVRLKKCKRRAGLTLSILYVVRAATHVAGLQHTWICKSISHTTRKQSSPSMQTQI